MGLRDQHLRDKKRQLVGSARLFFGHVLGGALLVGAHRHQVGRELTEDCACTRLARADEAGGRAGRGLQEARSAQARRASAPITCQLDGARDAAAAALDCLNA